MIDPQYAIESPDELLSPSLVIFVDLVRKNLATMIEMAGGADRLRPHVKTHKMPALIELVESMGIHKHKVATIAEAEMVAQAGGRDVLIAYPLVGPNADRFARLVETYPQTTFRTSVDHPDPVRALNAALAKVGKKAAVLLDLEVGMGRTGIAPGETAYELYKLIDELPNLEADGLQAYDGHVRDFDLNERRKTAAPGIEAVHQFRDRLLAERLSVNRMVLGGTPTFPIHADDKTPGVECSPGTCVLHDAGYAEKFPDLPFTPAALIFTRVVSKPRAGRVCLDLGHKAVAADPAGPRLKLLGLSESTLGGQSEEHLVVETPQAEELAPGQPLLAIPTHICPTCALHSWAYLIEGGKLVGRWNVTARDRVLKI